jgi:hypothetical protein
MLLFSTSSLRLGVSWWVIPGGLVRKIAPPGPLNMPSQKLQLGVGMSCDHLISTTRVPTTY